MAGRGDLEPGDVIDGKYRVERVLGQGGMGTVYAAKDTSLERSVAIKVLRSELREDAELASRFLREARAASRLSSEHTIRVHEIGELSDKTPYIVMEYLSGRDLKALLREGNLSVEQAVGYILQTLEAIAEAHSQGIVHRDLKPANLFSTKRADSSDLIKVLDFGLAKGPALAGAAQTESSAIFGSPFYMSPEQLQGSANVDRRTDIWALGVSLYELVTGRLPFQGRTVAELIARILRDPPTFPEDHRSDVPGGLSAILLRCLEKDPEDRYANVADLATVLEPYAPSNMRGAAERVKRVLLVASTTLASKSGAPAADPARTAPMPAPAFQDTVLDASPPSPGTKIVTTLPLPPPPPAPRHEASAHRRAPLLTLILIGVVAAPLVVWREWPTKHPPAVTNEPPAGPLPSIATTTQASTPAEAPSAAPSVSEASKLDLPSARPSPRPPRPVRRGTTSAAAPSAEPDPGRQY
jgi:serine/threonine-protein kinase